VCGYGCEGVCVDMGMRVCVDMGVSECMDMGVRECVWIWV